MFDFIEDLQESISLLEKARKYEYVIGFHEGIQETADYKVTNDNLFYIIDNGLPKYNIPPRNICRRFREWFDSEIRNDLESRLYELCTSEDYNEAEVFKIYESYVLDITNWYKGQIKMIKIFDLDMNKFADQIYVKIICKDI